jgi:hypothetical protein
MYLDEIYFRYNRRRDTDQPMFVAFLQLIEKTVRPSGMNFPACQTLRITPAMASVVTSKSGQWWSPQNRPMRA